MESLSRVLYSLHIGTPQHGPWVVACLEGAWPKVLGDRLAASCRPVSFKNSCLAIEVRDPSWMQPLQEMRADIEAKLSKATGDVVLQVSFIHP